MLLFFFLAQGCVFSLYGAIAFYKDRYLLRVAYLTGFAKLFRTVDLFNEVKDDETRIP